MGKLILNRFEKEGQRKNENEKNKKEVEEKDEQRVLYYFIDR